MENIICALEFKEGKPLAKEKNAIQKERPEMLLTGKTMSIINPLFKAWQQAESNRREFEISEKCHSFDYDFCIFKVGIYQLKRGDIFTATIENNVVMKIDLLQ